MNLRTIGRRTIKAAAATAIATVVTLAPQMATAAPKPEPPGQMRVAISVTGVHGICQLKYGTVYCGSKEWNKKVAAAWNGAEAHPSRADRNPVIFPAAISKVFKNRIHVVYVIHYKPNDRNTRDWVWKFGQTSGATWQDRANESRRICEMSKSPAANARWKPSAEQPRSTATSGSWTHP